MRYDFALVEIFVKTSAGDGKSGELATGYPVTEGFILTARHAIFPRDDNDNPKPVYGIYVRWYHQKGDARDRIQLNLDDYIAWDGYEKLKLDVVLLKCTFPPDVTYKGGWLSNQRPELGLEWESEGFAKAGQIDKARPPTEIWGDMPSAGDAEKTTFKLGARYPPDTDAGWKGASGSPVMLKTGAIIGVIESCQGNFNAALLNATPVWKLLEDPEFCERIGYDAKKQENWALHELKAKLQDNSTAREQLAKSLRQPTNAPNVDALANALLKQYPPDLIDIVIDAHKQLDKLAGQPESEQLATAAQSCIDEILYTLLPTVFEAQNNLAALVDSKKEGFNYTLLELPVATKTIVEIMMAGVDLRPTAFRRLGKNDDLPEGIFSLSDLPPAGMNELDTFKDRFTACLIEKFTGEDVREQMDQIPTQIELTKIQLQRRAKRRNEAHSFYYVYKLPADEREGQVLIPIIEELQIIFREIAFINLSTDNKLFVQEYANIVPLAELLRKRPPPPMEQTP